MEEQDQKKFSELVRKNCWKWAKSERYRDMPHSYVTTKARGMTNGECKSDDMREMLKIIKKYGEDRKFIRTQLRYLEFEGYKYWCCREANREDFLDDDLLNREKLFDEFKGAEYEPYYTNQEYRDVCVEVMRMGEKILEIGCGDGKFVRATRIAPKNYKGVEPNKRDVEKFRELNKGYHQSVRCCAYEQMSTQVQNDSVIIALFGSASYVMPEYIRLMQQEKTGNKLFLMFYNEGYCPEYAKGMHHFKYTKKWLENEFGKVEERGNYMVVKR